MANFFCKRCRRQNSPLPLGAQQVHNSAVHAAWHGGGGGGSAGKTKKKKKKMLTSDAAKKNNRVERWARRRGGDTSWWAPPDTLLGPDLTRLLACQSAVISRWAELPEPTWSDNNNCGGGGGRQCRGAFRGEALAVVVFWLQVVLFFFCVFLCVCLSCVWQR